MAIGASEANPFSTGYQRDLVRCGLDGGKLAISDTLDCIKAAAPRVLPMTWQRCRFYLKRKALEHPGKTSRQAIPAFIATTLARGDHPAVKAKCWLLANQMRGTPSQLVPFMYGADEGVWAT